MEKKEAKTILQAHVIFACEKAGLSKATVKAVEDALDMAISALDEQDREAIPHRNYQYLSDYWCECGWHLGKKGDVKFCADCGRRIKWD